MSNVKDNSEIKDRTPTESDIDKHTKAFIARHDREPDWGEAWVIAGNRRIGVHYKRQMKKNGLPVYLDEWTDIEWNRMTPNERVKSKEAKRVYANKLKRWAKEDKEEAIRAKRLMTGDKKGRKSPKRLLMPRVLHLLDLEYTYEAIAEDVGVNPQTISKWLNSVGIKKRKNSKAGEGSHAISHKGGSIQEELDISLSKGEISKQEKAIQDRKDLDKKTPSHRRRVELEDKNNALPEMFRPSDDGVADGETPASKYSGFMANALSTKMKESLQNLPNPQTYRDLKILDDMMCKHLGIGAGGSGGNGGGSGRLTIDVEILNAKGRPRGQLVAAELVEQNETVIEEMTEMAHEIEAQAVKSNEIIDEFDVIE